MYCCAWRTAHGGDATDSYQPSAAALTLYADRLNRCSCHYSAVAIFNACGFVVAMAPKPRRNALSPNVNRSQSKSKKKWKHAAPAAAHLLGSRAV